jgi:hypothetical protein
MRTFTLSPLTVHVFQGDIVTGQVDAVVDAASSRSSTDFVPDVEVVIPSQAGD